MPRGRLIAPWLVAQGMAQCEHVPPCCRDSCIVAVGGKAFPQGQVSNHRQVSPVGSQVPRHGGALGSVPGWMHVQALCLPTLVALACPVAVTDRAAP